MDQGEITLGSSLPPFREDELSGRVLLFPDQPHGSSLPPPPTHPISWQCAQRGEARAVRHARRAEACKRAMWSSFGQAGAGLRIRTAHAASAHLCGMRAPNTLGVPVVDHRVLRTRREISQSTTKFHMF